MAEKRMFSRKVVESDAFLDMPLSAQALYFHLCMEADDEGFVASSRKICRGVGASADDLKLLIAKRFVLLVDEVIVIKHWRINNTVRADRSKPTVFQEQLAKLSVKSNNAYTDNVACQPSDNQVPTNCQPSDNQVPTQIRLDKIRLDKISLDKIRLADAPQNGGAFEMYSNSDPDIYDLLLSFAIMRADKGAPMTEDDKRYIVDRLRTFPRSDWAQILTRSINNKWSNIYENPKANKNSQVQTTTAVTPDYESRVLEFIKGG